MEKLMKLAKQAVDQAEIYYTESVSDSLSFTDSKFDKADTSLRSGMALRIIKDGRIGYAHTRNLLSAESLLDQAIQSSKEGMSVNFQMPLTTKVKELNSYNPAIEKISKKDLISQAKKMIEYVQKRTDGQLNLSFGYGTDKAGIINSAGTSLEERESSFYIVAELIFPGTGSGLYKYIQSRELSDFPYAKLDEMIDLFLISKNEVIPCTGKLPVIFADGSISVFLNRFMAAASPVSIYNKVSPLLNRFGEQIVSDKFTLWQDPHDMELLSCTAFDGEGMPTQKLTFIDKGTFKAIPLDLNYAEKLGMLPTGNGLRGAIEGQPSAQPINYCIATGNKSLAEMIASIDKGLIVQSLMGGHSGNVLNGDYSVGVSTGFYIEKGRIVGRVKDCLLSGNAYESLSNIAEIENSYPNPTSSKIPSILIDGMNVAGK